MARQSRTSANRSGKVRRMAFRVAIAAVSLFVLAALLFAYPLIAVNWFPRDVWLALRPDLVAGDITTALTP
jgi:hypothetical protein